LPQNLDVADGPLSKRQATLFSLLRGWAHQGDLYKPTLDTWLEEDENADTIDNTGEDDAVALAPVGENDDQEAQWPCSNLFLQ
jgi:hypothetical protein